MTMLSHGVTGTKDNSPAKSYDDDILGPKQGMVDYIPEKYLQDERNKHGGKGKYGYIDLKEFPEKQCSLFQL
jgi:hypothetical protein